MKELIKKINETFNVDVLSKKKTSDIVWFRYYIMDKLMMNSVSECCEIMNRNEKQIYNLRKKIPIIRNRSEFKAISRIVKSMDPILFQDFVNPINKIPTSQVMEVLRKNRNSPLWNVEIKDWGKKEWGIFRRLKL